MKLNTKLHSKIGTPIYVYDGKFWDFPNFFKNSNKTNDQSRMRILFSREPRTQNGVDGVMNKATIKPFQKFIRIAYLNQRKMFIVRQCSHYLRHHEEGKN